jgi:transposase
LIVTYSSARARKDKHNRARGLRSLEVKVKSGKLTKGHINNRGYNKYLRIEGEVNIQIDYEKYESDNQWDGLKGYLTNSNLPAPTVLAHYQNLWQIEKAFRISKTDLQIRPIYHRLRRRIEAHICVCFTAYTIYKELERLMQAADAPFSVLRAIDLTQTMYQLTVQLPESRKTTKILLKLTEEQQWLMDFIQRSV